MTRLLVAFIVVLSLTAQKCDFDLGDLNQYVVTYELTITNSSPIAGAAVTVRMKGVTRSATLFKGRSLAVIGFAGGDYTVTVGDIGLRLSQLRNRANVLKVLVDTAATPARVEELKPQLEATMQAIATVESGKGGTTCRGAIKPGKRVTIVLGEQAGVWHC